MSSSLSCLPLSSSRTLPHMGGRDRAAKSAGEPCAEGVPTPAQGSTAVLTLRSAAHVPLAS